jgi:hypothetical protein
MHTLNDPVHPIWQQDSMFAATVDMTDRNKSEDAKLSDVVYERVRPAFQLALLILHASNHFWLRYVVPS